ncbi:MAG TPA: ABC transporter permease [Hyphomicrobiales bacterium]|nr:ABC transporter permease [Hyphomicrobiales bacterium]
MTWFSRAFANRSLRAFVLLAVIVAVLAVADQGRGRFLNVATAFSVLQQFATIGPVALALGLTMIIREYDISVGGMLSLSACVAVIVGNHDPWLGIVAALVVGLASGAAQGAIMNWLGLSSLGVTLGGLLTLSGLGYVLTGNDTIGFDDMDTALLMNQPFLGLFSVRNVAAIVAFVLVAFLFARTRIGRDVVATGSDRRAAATAGVPVRRIVVGIFMASGALTALVGALLSYSLAAASPIALADALVPGTAAAIIGGVSLTGGKGTPVGIAGGVLVLCALRSGLTAIGVAPYTHYIVTGGVLLAVALLDAPDLRRRQLDWRRRFAREA